MGLFDKLKQLKDELLQLALEPDRVEAWLTHLQARGVQAEVEWQPADLTDVRGSGRLCIATIRIYGAPFDRLQLVKNTSSQSTQVDRTVDQKIFYQDHFLIDLPERGPVDPPKARRRAKRAVWIFGRVLHYEWRGGPLAQRLAADEALNRVLDASNEGKITIRYDRRRAAICIARHYVGMQTHAHTRGMLSRAQPGENGTALGSLMRVAGVEGEIAVDYHLPSREVLQAYAGLSTR